MEKQYVKIFVSVPTRQMTRMLDGRVFDDPPRIIRDVISQLASIGVGKVGNYDNVSFSTAGRSFYRAIPGSGATPTAGKEGEVHSEEEEAISFIAPRESLPHIMRTLKENHPYEVPAIDVLELVRYDGDSFG